MKRWMRSSLLRLSALSLSSMVLLSACDTSSDDPVYLLAAPQLVPMDGALYALSSGAGAIVQVHPGAQGETGYTDQEGVMSKAIHLGTITSRMTAIPAAHQILVFTEMNGHNQLLSLHPEKPCNGAEPVETSCVSTLEAHPLHDSLVVSPDGHYALSYISVASSNNNTDVVVNLNEVGIYNLVDGTVRFATVGFSPSSFAFTTTGDPRVVLLTSTDVVLLDLTTGAVKSRELTLNTTSTLHPRQVLLTGDEQLALVTISGSADLYTFDLTQESLPINIISLTGTAGQMINSPSGNSTVILADAGAELNVLQHSDFSLKGYTLTGKMDTLLTIPGREQVVAYDADNGSHYLNLLDLEHNKVQAWLLDNPAPEVRVSPDGDALLLFYVPDYSGSDVLSSNYGMAVLNLKKGDRQPTPLLLGSYPTGALFIPGAEDALDAVYVTVPDDGSGALAHLNLFDYSVEVYDLPPLPIALAALPEDGRAVVMHNSPLGLISIFSPDDPEGVQFITHFMTTDLF